MGTKIFVSQVTINQRVPMIGKVLQNSKRRQSQVDWSIPWVSVRLIIRMKATALQWSAEPLRAANGVLLMVSKAQGHPSTLSYVLQEMPGNWSLRDGVWGRTNHLEGRTPGGIPERRGWGSNGPWLSLQQGHGSAGRSGGHPHSGRVTTQSQKPNQRKNSFCALVLKLDSH